MILKLKISAEMKVLTGLHIGDNTGFAPIGALDNPVIRDSYTGDPIVPGSSLKGKMRYLLARAAQPEGVYVLNECKDDADHIIRLFGSPGDSKENNPVTAHLQFSDAFLTNREEMMKVGGLTEVKAENTIKRSTSIANPRSNERVVRGAKFGVNWYYTMDRPEYLIEDMETLAEGCKLLSLDYLGGSGTRGYGRVEFDHFTIEVAYGKLPDGIDIEQLRKPFEDVNTYAVQGI